MRSRAQADLGRAYLHEGNPEGAVEVLEKAVKLDPGNWTAWNHLGMAYMEKNRPEQAERALKKSIKLSNGKAEPLLNYGLVLFAQGKAQEAVLQYRLALEDITYRKSALILNNLGYALFSLQRYDEALSALRRAVDRAPNLCQARFNMGLVLRAMDRPDEALASFEQVILMCPDAIMGAYLNAGDLLMQTGHSARALEYLGKVIEKAPDSDAAAIAVELLKEAGLRWEP